MAEIGDHHVCFHPGDNSGFGVLNLLVPAEALTIILLANDEELNLWKLGQRLLQLALEETWEAEREADGHTQACVRCDSISSIERNSEVT